MSIFKMRTNDTKLLTELIIHRKDVGIITNDRVFENENTVSNIANNCYGLFIGTDNPNFEKILNIINQNQ